MPSKSKKAKKQAFSSRFSRYSFPQLFLAALVVAVIGGYFTWTSMAATNNARPSRGSSSTMALRMVVDNNGDGRPNWGDQIKFDVSTTATAQPYVEVLCYQNNAVVYSAQTGYFDSYPWPWTQTFTLGSQTWTGGDASCSARMYYFTGKKNPTLATRNFLVYS